MIELVPSFLAICLLLFGVACVARAIRQHGRQVGWFTLLCAMLLLLAWQAHLILETITVGLPAATRLAHSLSGLALSIAASLWVRRLVLDRRHEADVRRALHESETAWRLLFEKSSDAIFILDPSNRLVEVNEKSCSLLGYSRSEILQRAAVDLVHPDYRSQATERLRAAWNDDSHLHERVLVRKNGSVVLAEVSSTPLPDGRLMATVRNISERKSAERALELSEAKYRALIETTCTGFVILDEHGCVLDANPEYVRLTGRHTSSEIRGRSVIEWTAPSDLSRNAEELSLCQVVGHTRNLEIDYVAPDGTCTPVEINATAVHSDGAPRILSLCRDISSRRLAARALRESEQRYRSLYNAMLTGFVLSELVLDEQQRPVNFRIIDINPAAERLLNTTRDQLLGRLAGDQYPAFAQRWIPACAQAALFGETHPMQYYSERVNRYFEGTIFGYGKGLFALAFLDISERVCSELALRESERLHRSLVDLSPDGIFIYADTGIVFANDSFVRMMKAGSINELIGLRVDQFVEANSLAFVHRRLRELHSSGGPNPPAEERFLCRDESTFDAEVASVTIRWNDQPAAQIIVHDISERKRSEQQRQELEEQLRLSQKLETIGTLAAGIAHDFNNLLVPVIGYTELTAADLPPECPGSGHLSEVLKAAYRAKSLVSQILSFSRQQEGEKRPLQLSSIVKEVLKMLRSTLSPAISLSRNIDNNSSVVLADPTQMHQVLMNLCVNASQAMPQGGSLSVSLRDLTDTRAVCPGCGLALDGPFVYLSIADTGHGMDPSVQKRIFDPFFTTKPVGKGSGLGLAVTQGIIAQHGGHICVVSEVDRGSTFHVLLPAAVAEPEDSPRNGHFTHPASGSILLVDDDPSALQTIAQTLEEQGYQVTRCGSPDQAVEIFRAHPGAYDLILTDFRMPSMTGDQLAVELLRIRPEIPILILSGYGDSTELKNARGIGIRDVLLKPASSSDLSTAIQQALTNLQSNALVPLS